MSVISCEELTKVYYSGFWRLKKTVALNNLSFEVNKGEIYGLLGPNGAGKTTTLKLILGLTHPTKGTVKIMGKSPKEINTRRYVGFLPEQPYFYEYLNAVEFLMLSAQMYGINRAEGKISEMLEIVGLTDAKGMLLKNFSRGMLQRIGLAQALLSDPEIIILDEPMGGLDPIGRKEVRDLILNLRRQNKTIIFSSHILSDAEMLCDRIGILIKGEMVKEGRLSEILKEEIESIEVVFSQVKEVFLKDFELLGERVIRSGDKVMVVVNSELKAERVIKLVEELGGKVYSLTPRRKTLEEYFFSFVKERNAT